jgi:hypothetical protein
MSQETKLEFRITWSATSNISFHGATPWKDGEDWGEDAEEIEDALDSLTGDLPEGLQMAIEASGFEWNVETQEVTPDAT